MTPPMTNDLSPAGVVDPVVPFNNPLWNRASKARDDALSADANDQIGALGAAFEVLSEAAILAYFASLPQPEGAEDILHQLGIDRDLIARLYEKRVRVHDLGGTGWVDDRDCSKAADAITSLSQRLATWQRLAVEAETNWNVDRVKAAEALNNKYAWERDKAREERDAAESRSEAFWKPKLQAAEARLAVVKAVRDKVMQSVKVEHKLFLIEAEKHSEWFEKYMDMTRRADAAEAQLAHAREAEIEECAKVTEACRVDIERNPHDFDAGGIRASDKIAAAIRAMKGGVK